MLGASKKTRQALNSQPSTFNSFTNLCPHLPLAAIRAYEYNEPVNPTSLCRVGVGVAGDAASSFWHLALIPGAFAEGGGRRDKPVGSLFAIR